MSTIQVSSWVRTQCDPRCQHSAANQAGELGLNALILAPLPRALTTRAARSKSAHVAGVSRPHFARRSWRWKSPIGPDAWGMVWTRPPKTPWFHCQGT